MAKIEIGLTTYVARHSMATNLKFSGVNTAVIQLVMGHKNIGMTETYLNSFGNDVLDNAMENLM